MRTFTLSILVCLSCFGQFNFTDPAFKQTVPPAAAGGGPSFPSGDTHYWRFDDNKNDSVDSVPIDGGSGETYVTGIHNHCMSVDNVDITSTGTLPFTSAFTLSVWMNFASGGNLNLYDGNVDVYIQVGGGNVAASVGGINELDVAETDGAWHLIVLTYDGGIVQQLSVDGANFVVGVATAPASVDIIDFNGVGSVGKYDECGFWPRVLTQTEVNNLWNGGAGLFP